MCNENRSDLQNTVPCECVSLCIKGEYELQKKKCRMLILLRFFTEVFGIGTKREKVRMLFKTSSLKSSRFCDVKLKATHHVWTVSSLKSVQQRICEVTIAENL